MGKVVYLPVTNKRALARPLVTSTLIWIRTIGDRALAPTICLMCIVAVVGHFQLLSNELWAYWCLVSALLALIMTIPLSILILEADETWIEVRAKTKRQTSAREDLTKSGLTPERYLASLPVDDWLGRARAEERFGL